jgi:deoxyribodipyrimidine photo-lyase
VRDGGGKSVVSVAVVLFTRDLRVHDNPTFAAAVRASDRVVPLFVLDSTILSGNFNRPNRAAFLRDALADLDAALRARGAGLVVRSGDVVEETAAIAAQVGAHAVHISRDASGYAQRRQERLGQRLSREGRDLRVHDATMFVVAPGVISPVGKDYMAVFTPYHRRWEKRPRRDLAPTPRVVRMPRLRMGSIPSLSSVCSGTPSPHLAVGGETVARHRMSTWLGTQVDAYQNGHDAVADDATSRLSPYLHFGCLSPLEIARRAGDMHSASAAAFIRQLAWRDFHHQVLAARPDAVRNDYRSRGDRWHHSDEEFTAWREGSTGYPIVDAGMRQLSREGWMHNRARLITAHFLTKTLYIDWRLGAAHFFDLLVDGDVANNTMNWQWCAGTGTDSRFNRSYNVTTQAKRHDPNGMYVRRYVEELSDVDDKHIHEPWLLPQSRRESLGYPAPIVDQDEARERIRRVRSRL